MTKECICHPREEGPDHCIYCPVHTVPPPEKNPVMVPCLCGLAAAPKETEPTKRPLSKCCGAGIKWEGLFNVKYFCARCEKYVEDPFLEASTPTPKEPVSPSEDEWEEDWLGYCRTYLTRYGIKDEIAILSIAGNLEQVVKKLLAHQREKETKITADAIEMAKQGWIDEERQRLIYNQALSDLQSSLKSL